MQKNFVKILNDEYSVDTKEIDLDKKEMSFIPNNLLDLLDLEVLNLKNNRFVELDEKIANFKKLKELYLSKNHLETLPLCIGDMISLEILCLDDNKLTDISFSFEKLVNLKTLYLFNNKLTVLPIGIENLINLEKLHLQNNQLREISTEIGALINLKELHLDQNILNDLPEAFEKLTNLKKLYLGKNNFEKIPECIMKLVNLEILDLHSNKISDLTDNIDSWMRINSLNFSGNRIKKLPDSIGNLVGLKKLHLYGNLLENLPDVICKLANLEELILFENNLIELPRNIGNLVKLGELSLYRNKLKSIPESISKLVKLRTLSFYDNQINSLPLSMAKMPLTFLDLRKNLLVDNDYHSLGKSGLIEVFGDRVLFDDLSFNDDVIDEKTLFREIESNPICWNLKKLKSIKLRGVKKTILNKRRMIEIVDKAFNIDLINQNDRYDLINYIDMLYGNSNIEYKRWMMDKEYIPVTINLLGNILEDIDSKIDSNRIDLLKYGLDSIAEGIRFCPDRQMAELRYAYSTITDEEFNGLNDFITHRIAVLKNNIFEVVITPPESSQNVHVLNYWKKELDDLLGFDFNFDTGIGTMGQDPFNGHHGNALKAFFDHFTPEYIISILTNEINDRSELKHSMIEMLEKELSIEKRREIEFDASSNSISEKAVEYILTSMDIIGKGEKYQFSNTYKRRRFNNQRYVFSKKLKILMVLFVFTLIYTIFCYIISWIRHS